MTALHSSLLVLAGALGCSAADWPMFRSGPALTGVAPGTLPDKGGFLCALPGGGLAPPGAVVLVLALLLGARCRGRRS